MPQHLLLSARKHTLLFHDHNEARALWLRLLRHVPDPAALCLMPDHVHLLHGRDVRTELGLAASAYARWRNGHRGQRGPVFRPQPRSWTVLAGVKTRRAVRYIHLNPCRARLVDCPLAWTWSTHREGAGLTLGTRGRARDPEGFHRYVSSDPSASVAGTALPWAAAELPDGARGLILAQACVSEILRLPLAALEGRGPGRSLVLRMLCGLTDQSTTRIAGLVGVASRTVRDVPRRRDPTLLAAVRLAGDPRFPGLVGGDLRRRPEWAAYCRAKGVRPG